MMRRERRALRARRDASVRFAAEPPRQRTPRPSLGMRNLPDQFFVLIDCASEAEQLRLLARFQVEGLRCRALIS